jgi:hypothetical protein
LMSEFKQMNNFKLVVHDLYCCCIAEKMPL